MPPKKNMKHIQGRRHIGLHDLVTNAGNADWHTFIKKQNVHLGDPDMKEEVYQRSQNDSLRRMYLFPPAWGEHWPGLFESGEMAASRSMQRGGASIDDVAALAPEGTNGYFDVFGKWKGPKPVTRPRVEAVPSGSKHRSGIALEQTERFPSETGSYRQGNVQGIRDDTATFKALDNDLSCQLNETSRTKARAEMLRTKSDPGVPRQKFRYSDGRPPCDQFYNFATLYKRPIPGKSGTFGSAGWAGSTGLGGRSVQPQLKRSGLSRRAGASWPSLNQTANF